MFGYETEWIFNDTGIMTNTSHTPVYPLLFYFKLFRGYALFFLATRRDFLCMVILTSTASREEANMFKHIPSRRGI